MFHKIKIKKITKSIFTHEFSVACFENCHKTRTAIGNISLALSENVKTNSL